MAENGAEMPVHFISFVHDRETIRASFECKASPDAKCHQYPSCDCGGWCECSPVTQEECWAAGWMAESCAEECFTGPVLAPVHDGPIHVTFDGDCLTWDYLDTEARK